MCRKTSGGTGPGSGSGPPKKLSPASIPQVQQSQQFVAPRAVTAAQPNDSHDNSDAISSLSSSVFRRDDRGKGDRHNTPHDKSAAALLLEESSLRDARLDAQHRLRLLPAALWGERARLADGGASDAADGEETEPAAVTRHQRHTFLTEGASAAASAKEGARPAATLNHCRAKGDIEISTGKKRKKDDATPAARKSSSDHRGRGDGTGFALPIGASALFAQAASLKRTAVTGSVPLRWQSRVIALSSLRDSFREGATRGSPSMGRKMAIRRCRAYQRTKAKRSGVHRNNSPRDAPKELYCAVVKHYLK